MKYPIMIFFNKVDLKIKTKIHEIMKVQPSSFLIIWSLPSAIHADATTAERWAKSYYSNPHKEIQSRVGPHPLSMQSKAVSYVVPLILKLLTMQGRNFCCWNSYGNMSTIFSNDYFTLQIVLNFAKILNTKLIRVQYFHC